MTSTVARRDSRRWAGLALGLAFLLGCGPAAVRAPAPVAGPAADETAAVAPATPSACDAVQAGILAEADARAAPWSLAQHLDRNFADGKIGWLMPEAIYDKYVVQTHAPFFGRCNDTACYQFAAPAAVIHAAVAAATTPGGHDPAILGKALGLPAKNLEGPLRMLTLDVRAADICVRLPVEADPGVWACTSPDDHDCFQFGGYTSGGLPEIMAINAPVDQAVIEVVP